MERKALGFLVNFSVFSLPALSSSLLPLRNLRRSLFVNLFHFIHIRSRLFIYDVLVTIKTLFFSQLPVLFLYLFLSLSDIFLSLAFPLFAGSLSLECLITLSVNYISPLFMQVVLGLNGSSHNYFHTLNLFTMI